MAQRATQAGCTRGEFGVFVGNAVVFCTVNSQTDRDVDEVVTALNQDPAPVNIGDKPRGCGDFQYPTGHARTYLCGRCGYHRHLHPV